VDLVQLLRKFSTSTDKAEMFWRIKNRNKHPAEDEAAANSGRK
jgi:hypothetical protein